MMQEVLCNEAESVAQNLLGNYLEKIQPGAALKLLLHNVIFFYSQGVCLCVQSTQNMYTNITCVLHGI